MITIEAYHESEKQTLSIKEWSFISGATSQKILGRYRSKNNYSNEVIVCLENPIFHNDRDDEIGDMFISGSTAQEIGDNFNISRQRVHQICKRKSISKYDGQRYHDSWIKKRDKRAELDNAFVSSCGCTRLEWRGYREFNSDYKKTPLHRYFQQKKNAKSRGIDWDININEWGDIWHNSGKWIYRGCCLGKYVMARFMDMGAYTVGNVYITTHSNNIREGYVIRSKNAS